jgi:uncharacterized damage-inducible protein DinB
VIRTIEEFVRTWKSESGFTRRVMDALTDDSLAQPVAEGHRDLGRIAWHIVQTLPELGEKVGLAVEGPEEEAPVPPTADAIARAYRTASAGLLARVRDDWTDETLAVEDPMYGESWARGFSLRVLLNHEIHHRAQMTVLLRQAGVRVPGIYGPAKEDWAAFGREPPEI